MNPTQKPASPFILALCGALAACCFASGLATAETVDLQAAKDNTLYEEIRSNSNGNGAFLFAGRTNQGNNRRALLAFDLSSLPAGATVTAVTLTLNQSRTISGNHTVTLHRLLQDWGEAGSDAGGEEGRGTTAHTGDATWDDAFFNVTLWSTSGGVFAPQASASVSVGNAEGPYTFSDAGLVDDVQHWLDQPDQNFGWALVGDESSNASAKRFNSRHSDGAPVLSIEFESSANDPPQIANPIPEQALRLGGPALLLNLQAEPPLFSDADGDSLSLSAGTSNASILDISLLDGLLSVAPLSTGDATVSVIATDPSGQRATAIFTVRVAANAQPIANVSAAPIELVAGEDVHTLDLNTLFSDADGDSLDFTVVSTDPTVAFASLDGAILSLTPLTAGSATISLIASDAFVGSATTTLSVILSAPSPPASTNDGFGVTLVDSAASLVAGDTLAVGLNAKGAVQAKGTLLTATYDAKIFGFIDFVPGTLIPGLLALPGSPILGADGLSTVQGGGTQLAGNPGAGEGLLGTLRFAVLDTIPMAGTFVSVTEVQLTTSASDRAVLSFAPGTFGVTVSPGGKTGDFSGDDQIDFEDFFLFADQFGTSTDSPTWDPAFDLAPNGAVDFDDFFAFADVFGL
jgi:hypothetical protein